ncbi:Rpn family recombination-promoting nuclease/putative transposase [Tumidithrix elongata RA019]|uniref:Rpn family recombination-promoting nuclease/putative transposase n=1 Tax=Tumidithrix elongata BACA0141 TaxID=2716417 RepID=A0AAW9Q7P7_9CYAN|nr:Rpn family recombination-promoting nuclease/putative transposase [Tumidithrix elongata RA019]
MRTDTLFYQLFQSFHTLLFELIEQPPSTADGYEFVSAEVKEKAFRFDGIFLPNTLEKPVIFAEVQFQPKDDFYWDLMSEICLYLRQYKPLQNWYAVAIFARRIYDPGESPHFQELFDSNRIVRVYLEDWLDRGTNSLGIAIVQLILVSEAKAPELVRQLAVQVEQETLPLLRDEVVEFIETVLVYKFPQLTRKEIEAMFTLNDLKHTRVYKDAKQEGRRNEAKSLLLRLLTKKLGTLNTRYRIKITRLSLEKMEALSEALLDFTNITDLDRWLEDQKLTR